MVDMKRKPLGSLHMDRIWPVLSPLHLSYLELKQDPYFSYIPKDQIPIFLHQSIAHGQEMAKRQPALTNYTDFLNGMLQRRLRIRFFQQHPTNPKIRAQYTHKPPTIDIFRNSIHQIQSFFEQALISVDEKDLIGLHLYHEFFHHLERQSKAERKIPKCILKQWGPFAIKKRLHTFREISAHAFTQTMMRLNWSPLLLDRLIYYSDLGWTHEQIREHFAKVKREFETFQEITDEPNN